LTPYATGLYRREREDLIKAGIEEAERHLSEGLHAMKLKVGLDRGRP
jgi:hypothetical protein